MALNIIVTVKQVPDTKNITGDAMKPDGTVNRGALPAIINPEDLNALEEALQVKEKVGGKITVVTMGPPNAIKALRECLYRGADDAILVSDRRFAGADTLATSFALKGVVEKIGDYDLIFSGRQAIDGDTAQVGPQLAEKLGINQITSILNVQDISKSAITVKRATDSGYEIVKSQFPVLLTVTSEANEPRFPSAKRVAAYKSIDKELSEAPFDEICQKSETMDRIKYIKEWNVDMIGTDIEACGLSGSPTKVKKVQNVVLAVSEMKQIPGTDKGVSDLINELTSEHIIG